MDPKMICLLFLGQILCKGGAAIRRKGLPDVKGSVDYYERLLENRWGISLVILVIAILVNFAGIRAKKLALSAIVFPMLQLYIGSIRKIVQEITEEHFGDVSNANGLVSGVNNLLEKMDTNMFFMVFLSVAVGLTMFFFVKVIIYFLVGFLGFHLWGTLEASIECSPNDTSYYISQAILLCLGILTLILVDPITFVIYIMVFSLFGSLFIIVGAKYGFGLSLGLDECINILYTEGPSKTFFENKISICYLSLFFMGVMCQLMISRKVRENK